jgi:hypothetical protein
MTRQPVPVTPVGATLAPTARLEPDAITAAQDTFIGAALVGLGFVTGWLMITGTLIGTLSPVIAVGPNICWRSARIRKLRYS